MNWPLFPKELGGSIGITGGWIPISSLPPEKETGLAVDPGLGLNCVRSSDWGAPTLNVTLDRGKLGLTIVCSLFFRLPPLPSLDATVVLESIGLGAGFADDCFPVGLSLLEESNVKMLEVPIRTNLEDPEAFMEKEETPGLPLGLEVVDLGEGGRNEVV